VVQHECSLTRNKKEPLYKFPSHFR